MDERDLLVTVRRHASLLDRRQSRLVVLTGAGGSGKTRLALEVAHRVASAYANGVALVELAPLRDPTLVVPTIAQALDVPLDGDEDPLGALADALGSRELLLVIDNAEHVREAAPAPAENSDEHRCTGAHACSCRRTT